MNFNFAKMEDDKSVGINGTFGPAGFGLILDKGANGAKNNTFYAAYSLPLFGVKGATITPALSFAKGGSGTKGQTSPPACASTTRFDRGFPIVPGVRSPARVIDPISSRQSELARASQGSRAFFRQHRPDRYRMK
jgi:hypothetical protein